MKIMVNSSRNEFVFPDGTIWEVGDPDFNFWPCCIGEEVRMAHSTYRVKDVINIFENGLQIVRAVLE